MIRIFWTGKHSHRMPMSYPALAPLFEGQIERVDDPARADLYLFTHVMDVEHAPRAMVEDWRQRQRPVVILSEEPFWDTIWGKRPMDPEIIVDSQFGRLPVIQINFQTSDVFGFDRIPYYLLTNPRFQQSYHRLFARNAARSAEDWRADWAARASNVVFMFERRPETHHDVTWPEGDVTGFCAWRTEIAETCTASAVERLGRSWQGGLSRFDLDDWHGDKLRQLDGRTRLMGAIENTHQPDYVTEKFFDAMACGAIPLYGASPGHRIHDFGLPSSSWINLYGLVPADAAARIASQRFDTEVAAGFATAQKTLAALFADDTLWEAERRALGPRVIAALQGVLDSPRPSF